MDAPNSADQPSDIPRRRVLRTGVAVGLASIAGCSASSGSGETDGGDGQSTVDSSAGDGDASGASQSTRVPTPTETNGPRPDLDGARVALEPVASGLSAPLDFVAPAGTDRRFVVDRDGRIWELGDDGRRETPFLDLSDRIVLGGERGLLGAAAHPNFAENGRLFVRYSSPPRQGTPDSFSHTAVLAEFTADPGADVVDVGTERSLLDVPQPQSNHNAGALAFGPDGYLYVALGDGGGSNDVGTGHVDDWYDGVEGGNGQDVTENLLGSILRIDVDGGDGGEDGGGSSGDSDASGDEIHYAVPDANPLVGREGLDEQYAWGFRNPWRLSFHGEDLYVADVGQGAWEELNLVERGGNYGWNVREGAHCFRSDACPDTSLDGEPFVDPVAAYAHDGDLSGVSIIGGFVAESDTVPGLHGAYVFADYVARGQLLAVDTGAEPPWEIATVPVVGDADLGQFVLGFGRDQTGDLLVLATDASGGEGDTGRVHRIVAP
ncbi:PQQ-dependent sugar dehydrogenase [Halobellus sp. GM3]|uniref:PQQ-dependent sugar dehydrogenase n=1 Tax=Halobellus sp. GM3 TaxID=3458410 RepID=UPI00403DFDE6